MKHKNIIETILLAYEKPISNDIIRKVVHQNLSDTDIKNIVNELNFEYKGNKKGIYIDFIANGYQVKTLPEFHKYISMIKYNSQKYTLTNAALEVLSIIAFKQPVSRLDIELIRGVDSVGIIKKLLDKKLIIIKKVEKNKKLLFYGTGEVFLETFGLNHIEDLKNMEDVKRLINKV